MNGQQTAAGALGLGLVAVNFWTSKQRTIISGGIFGGSAEDTAAAHTELKALGAELLFVAVAVLISGMSNSAGTAIVAILVALTVIWCINHFSKGKP